MAEEEFEDSGEEEGGMFRGRARLAVNLLKQDITIRTAEVLDSAGVLFRALKFNQETISPYQDFIEDFSKLYFETKHFIKDDRRKGVDGFFENLEVYNSKGAINVDENCLKIFDKYLKLMKEVGLLDIVSYTLLPKEAWRYSV